MRRASPSPPTRCFTRPPCSGRVELTRPPTAIGKNTVHALQSGLVFGYSELVKGMVARFRVELGGDPKVVATGGLADVVAEEVGIFDAVDPNLTLTGLRIVYEMNTAGPKK